MVAGLGEDLDHDVVGNPALVDQLTDEVEVGLGRRWADLDLLVHPMRTSNSEHAQLRGGTHRVDQVPGCRHAGRRRTSAGRG